MKKLISVLVLMLCAVTLHAQVSYDTVTATVLDPNGHPYANAQWSATLVNSVGNQVYSATTPNGQIYNAAAAPPQGIIQANGLLSMQLVPNNILINPAGTQWLITITFPADREILTYNPPWTINYTTPVTAPMDLSSQISALAQGIEFINLRTGQNTLNTTTAGVTQLIPLPGGNCEVTPSNGTGTVTFNCTSPTGFPITLGSTEIAANETVSELDDLIVNGVTLKTDGPATQYLDRTGNYSVPPGSGGTCTSGCVVETPGAGVTQTVLQQPGTNLNVNNFEGVYWADQYGTGSNGIETAYTKCLAQNGLGFSGCSIFVSPNYTNADVPHGWSFNDSFYSDIPFQGPPGAAVYDERNGTQFWIFRDPFSPITGQATGQALITSFDWSIAQKNAIAQGGNQSGRYTNVGIPVGGSEFNYYPGGLPQYIGESYTFGEQTNLSDWAGGIDFLHYGFLNKYTNGDSFLNWMELTADGGTLSANSEGNAAGDYIVREDPVVFTGTVVGTPATGATQIGVSATIGGATQGGMYRWLVNQSSPLFTGTQLTGVISELTTGSSSASAVMPPAIIDSTQTFPVSTLLQICYAGSDNGASGASGCTSGSQPVGYIPSQNYRLTITAGSVTAGVATFTITPTSPQTKPVQLVAGQSVILYGFPLAGNGAFLNQQAVTVLSAGLSTTGFEANVTGPDTAAVGTGFSTLSPTGYSPAQSIVVGIVPTYTTGGGTGGLPAGFCTPSTVQSSNPASACYLPASGVGCITDQIETECQNYTYNSGTSQITISNLQFPHLNGAVFAVGGLAGKAIEDPSSQYTGGGTSGVIDEVYPTAGSLDAHTVYYVPQRTNLGYASPPLGGSTDGGSANGGNTGQKTALCFSATMGSFSLNSGVVKFSMGFVAGTTGGQYPDYNNKTVTIAANGNASYNGNYAITVTSGNNFQYTPTSPTGTLPNSGTVSFCNANYKILDAARVASVANPSNDAIDGTFILFPNVASFSGATVREPHFQQMSMSGTHEAVTQFQPKVFTGGSTDSITYNGNISGAGWEFAITNGSNSSIYLGGGGTLPLPTNALGLFGPWLNIAEITAPQQAIWNVTGWNLAGPSSSLSNFGLFEFPQLPGSFPGYNNDMFCYDPDYNLANRGQALSTGEYIFANAVAPNCNIGPANGFLVSAVRMGKLFADISATIPEVNSNDVTVTALTNFINNAPAVIGDQSGSTTYNYGIVAHDENGGSNLVTNVGTVTHGQATLNGTNFNRVCAFFTPGVFSYDFLKMVSGVYQSMALNVAVGNGASHSTVPNYTCWDDQGASTSAYPLPSQNTTGSIKGSSIVATNSITTPTLLASGVVDGATPITTTTAAACTIGINTSGCPYLLAYKTGYSFNNDGSTAVTYTLPVAAPGLQYCITNDTGATGTITIQTSASGQFMDFSGVNSASGGYVISGGALGDAACVVGHDGTHWKLYVNSGTWTLH